MVKTYYAYVDTSNYLAHHGVKGMHWGVRRYQNAQGGLTAEGYSHYGYDKRSAHNTKQMDKHLNKEQKAHTQFFKTYHAERAAKYAADNKSINDFKKNTKTKRLYSNDFLVISQDNARANRLDQLSKAHERRAKEATKFGGYGHLSNEAMAFNNKEAAKTARMMANTKGLRRVGVSLGRMASAPYKTIYGGRTTTLGKELVLNSLTVGAYGTVADVASRHNLKKEWKAEKKAKKSK